MGRISVRLTPRAGRDVIDGWRARGPDAKRALHVRVSAAAVDGAANDALVRLIAKAIGVARSHVNIVTGAQSRDKVLEVDGVSDAEVANRIEAIVGPSGAGD